MGFRLLCRRTISNSVPEESAAATRRHAGARTTMEGGREGAAGSQYIQIEACQFVLAVVSLLLK
jgi:hypothetical protein